MSVCTDEVAINVTYKLVKSDVFEIFSSSGPVLLAYLFVSEVALGKIKMILKVFWCAFGKVRDLCDVLTMQVFI